MSLPEREQKSNQKPKTRRVTRRKRSEWWLFLLWLIAMAPVILQRCSNQANNAPSARVR